jgi:gas vesicle protein
MVQGKIILGVVAGLAAGSLIGILFAPDKGAATRKKIVDKSGEYVGGIREKIGELLKDGKNHDKVRETVSAAM